MSSLILRERDYHWCDATMMTQLFVIDNVGSSVWAILKCHPRCTSFLHREDYSDNQVNDRDGGSDIEIIIRIKERKRMMVSLKFQLRHGQ